MNEQKENQLRHEDANRLPADPAQKPYWTRAHRDWRIWVFVALMLTCMFIYIITGDLRWPIPGHAQPMISPAP